MTHSPNPRQNIYRWCSSWLTRYSEWQLGRMTAQRDVYVFFELSTSAPGPKQAHVQWHREPKQAHVQWHREAERSPPSGADVNKNVWRCTSVHPSDLIGWCYVNMLQLIQVSLCLPRDKIVKEIGIQWICSRHSQAVFLLCFTLKMNFFRALASAYLVITSRRCHTHRLESKAALVWEPRKIHFSRRFGYLFCYS